MVANVPQVWNRFFTDFKTINIMTQIEKYIERLKTLQNLYEEGQPQHNAFGIAIVEANEMLVKNCSIPAVVGQSEQLTAFAEYCDEEHGLFIPSWMIDGYNKGR